jgi:hypothetical protein
MAGTSTDPARGSSVRQIGRLDRRAGLLVVAILALAVALGLTAGSAGEPDPAPERRSGSETGFAALRTAPVSLPREVVRTMGPAAHGVDWSRAHRLPIPIPVKARFWAARGRGYLCIAVLTPGATTGRFCAPDATARAHGLAAVFLRTPGSPWFGTPGNRLIVGIAPENVRGVVASTQGRRSFMPLRTGGIFVRTDAERDPPDQTTVVR